mmetsp:Transcript_55256/g.171740  ORF Transcript_55256/g.171740 Transcript_55256/m.171740 type:complete len:271 (-) Transcript_55256:145-957(-)
MAPCAGGHPVPSSRSSAWQRGRGTAPGSASRPPPPGRIAPSSPALAQRAASTSCRPPRAEPASPCRSSGSGGQPDHAPAGPAGTVRGSLSSAPARAGQGSLCSSSECRSRLAPWSCGCAPWRGPARGVSRRRRSGHARHGSPPARRPDRGGARSGRSPGARLPNPLTPLAVRSGHCACTRQQALAAGREAPAAAGAAAPSRWSRPGTGPAASAAPEAAPSAEAGRAAAGRAAAGRVAAAAPVQAQSRRPRPAAAWPRASAAAPRTPGRAP